MNGKTVVILAAAGANLGIAMAKLGASLFTGSSAMLTEGIHSLVDTGNQGLLLLGQQRGGKPPDATHPFGYGMEVYFWSFVVALMIFALGGAVSIYEGIHKLLNPEPIQAPWVNFLVLGLSFAFESGSLLIAYREFSRTRPAGRSLLSSIHRSKDPSLFAVLLEDSAALAGLVLAALGVAGAAYLHLDFADGVASIAIGGLLIIVAAFLANETRSLLAGEAASQRVLDAIGEVLHKRDDLSRIGKVLTLHLGPQDIMVAIALEFTDDSSVDIGEASRELVTAVREVDERINRVFLGPIEAASSVN